MADISGSKPQNNILSLENFENTLGVFATVATVLGTTYLLGITKNREANLCVLAGTTISTLFGPAIDKGVDAVYNYFFPENQKNSDADQQEVVDQAANKG